MKGMIQRIKNAVVAAAAMMPGAISEDTICRLLEKTLETMAPAQALRWLFRLDNVLYKLQGHQSVAYGGGLHTKHRHIGYHDFFVNRIAADERVLDIGCGNGALACDVARRSGARVLAIDRQQEHIAGARRHFADGRVEYVQGDVPADLPEGHFDVVVMSNVLEHLPERTAFLRQVARRVRPQRFLIRVPLFERDWRVPLKKELGVEWRLDSTHMTEYTLESFGEEMRSAGLRITYREVRWGELWAEAVPAGDPDGAAGRRADATGH